MHEKLEKKLFKSEKYNKLSVACYQTKMIDFVWRKNTKVY